MYTENALEPPSYADCTIGPPALTLGVKDTAIYTPCANHDRNKHSTHYRITSSLNREFVKGGFGVYRVNPWKAGENIEVYDIRAVGDARFILSNGPERRAVSVQRNFGFSGHWWEVRRGGRVVLRARKMGREDGTLRWCDGSGRLIATDTKLVRGRGNRENCFLMPVLRIVVEVEREMLDLLVACWLARVWVEVVQAKKMTLMDAAYH